MPIRKLVFCTAMLLVASLSITSLHAQGLDTPEARLIAERPTVDGESTEVTVAVFLIDIDEIDDVRQRFKADVFVIVGWQDPRLALPGNEGSDQLRTIPIDEIWTPRGLIVNDRGLSPQLPLVAEVDAKGNVIQRQRLSGEMAVDLDLRKFPFDTQQLPIEFISYRYSPDELRFSPSSKFAAGVETFSGEGWRFHLLDPEFGEFTIPDAGVSRPALTFIVEAQRMSQYYLLTMFLPMSLIVFMSWTAFWIQPDVVPSRIAISTASIFSLIAFGFSIRLSLPRVSYVTLADQFVIGCTLLVFLALGAAVIGSRWAGADKLDRAVRLNAIVRWVYAAMFLIVVAVVMTSR
ncbi:MAG: hypothetical protein WBM57_16135 [Woeseiaceae bacterium]